MKNVKVLGTGCQKCKNTIALINAVANENHTELTLEKVEDPAQIMAYGVMSTPAVIINEKLVHKGSVPKRKTVEAWFSG